MIAPSRLRRAAPCAVNWVLLQSANPDPHMALARPSALSRVCAPVAPAPASTPPPVPTYKIAVEPHMPWARMLARVVRAEEPWCFRAGSSQEAELELVAYMQLCVHAVRFEPSRLTHGTPDNLFQGWAKRGILKECRRAADKLFHGGVTQLPESRGVTPACESCTEFVERASADLRRPGSEEAESPAAAAEAPVVVAASFPQRPLAHCPVLAAAARRAERPAGGLPQARVITPSRGGRADPTIRTTAHSGRRPGRGFSLAEPRPWLPAGRQSGQPGAAAFQVRSPRV